jgi:DnaJ family protein C protein 19
MSHFFLMAGIGILGVTMLTKQFSRAVTMRRATTSMADAHSSKAWKYYGPFEPSINRREAALILGVRESTETKKILEAHRRLMLMNHPDNGGSTFIATKIN